MIRGKFLARHASQREMTKVFIYLDEMEALIDDIERLLLEFEDNPSEACRCIGGAIDTFDHSYFGKETTEWKPE